ncbi:hypothetical protein T11_7939, partial [Trichinella zimbabwensis]
MQSSFEVDSGNSGRSHFSANSRKFLEENRFGLRQVGPQAGSGTSKEQHSRWLRLSSGWSQPALLGWKE